MVDSSETEESNLQHSYRRHFRKYAKPQTGKAAGRCKRDWIPAVAGMTKVMDFASLVSNSVLISQRQILILEAKKPCANF
jgi:hypothetical protein